jgi:hypothetical protein
MNASPQRPFTGLRTQTPQTLEKLERAPRKFVRQALARSKIILVWLANTKATNLPQSRRASYIILPTFVKNHPLPKQAYSLSHQCLFIAISLLYPSC